MKINSLIILFFCISSLVFSQQKLDKCDKLSDNEQKLCKDHLISDLVSDWVVYPQDALENMDEGTVYVRFTTDENQELNSIRALGKNDPELVKAAQLAIEKFANSDARHILAKNEVYRIPVKFTVE